MTPIGVVEAKRENINVAGKIQQAERFKRILFLVDRTALGQQAIDVFNDTPLEQNQTLSRIYNIAELGEALIPFEQRVQNAMRKILELHSWTPIQRKWLERLATQLTHEVVLDHDFVNRAFAANGGAKQLNKLLGEQLDLVLENLADELWDESG